jgi:hypothetical protein
MEAVCEHAEQRADVEHHGDRETLTAGDFHRRILAACQKLHHMPESRRSGMGCQDLTKR